MSLIRFCRYYLNKVLQSALGRFRSSNCFSRLETPNYLSFEIILSDNALSFVVYDPAVTIEQTFDVILEVCKFSSNVHL